MALKRDKHIFREKFLVTGIIPCCNSENTVGDTILSLKAQSVPLHEILIVDDGSTDRTADIAKSHDCRVISFSKSRGRGFARKVGIDEASTPFVLFCDSSNIIDPKFLEIALRSFTDQSVSACFGRILNHESLNDSLSRWRGRHLFKEDNQDRFDLHTVDCLITYATLVKKDHFINAGNFDPNLRQCEDQDMGDKLTKARYTLISNPQLLAYSLRKESFKSLCFRYHRWNSRYDESQNLLNFFWNTLRECYLIFARKDFNQKDYKCMVISISLPLYLVWLKLVFKL